MKLELDTQYMVQLSVGGGVMIEGLVLSPFCAMLKNGRKQNNE